MEKKKKKMAGTTRTGNQKAIAIQPLLNDLKYFSVYLKQLMV